MEIARERLSPDIQTPSPLWSWFKDTLSIDSFLSAFLILFGSTVGSGMLALPYVFQVSGWPFAVFGLLAVILLNWFTSYLLFQVTDEHHRQTMEMLTYQVFQSNSSTTVTTVLRASAVLAVFVFNYGTLMSYMIVVLSNQIETAFVSVLGTTEPYFPIICGFATVILTFPLCSVKYIGSLRYFAILSFILPFIFAIFLIDRHPSNTCNARPDFIGLIFSLPIMLFATTCQPNIGDLYLDLANRKHNGPRMLSAVFSLVFGLYVIVGYFGCGNEGLNYLSSSEFPKEKVGGKVVGGR